uniref:Uncharacterized protein n=1 Tax=Arundo donax TaxID=35708 RepID=A0A0A9U3J7_ARUDO
MNHPTNKLKNVIVSYETSARLQIPIAKAKTMLVTIFLSTKR